jgi:hypothetical protein
MSTTVYRNIASAFLKSKTAQRVYQTKALPSAPGRMEGYTFRISLVVVHAPAACSFNTCQISCRGQGVHLRTSDETSAGKVLKFRKISCRGQGVHLRTSDETSAGKVMKIGRVNLHPLTVPGWRRYNQ